MTRRRDSSAGRRADKSLLPRAANFLTDALLAALFFAGNRPVRTLAMRYPRFRKRRFDHCGIEFSLDITDYTQRKIWFRSFERAELRFVEKVLRPGDIAIDIGANIGFFTVAFRQQVKSSGFVIAVEPVHETFRTLAANTSSFGNVTCLEFAASSSEGVVEMSAHHDGPDKSSGFYRILSRIEDRGTAFGEGVEPTQHIETALVESRRLEGIVASYSDRRIRLVKCDVEGHEIEALKGLGDLLSPQFIDYVVFETMHKSGDEAGLENETVRLLRERGFLISSIAADGTLVDSPRRVARSLRFHGGVENLVAFSACAVPHGFSFSHC